MPKKARKAQKNSQTKDAPPVTLDFEPDGMSADTQRKRDAAIIQRLEHELQATRAELENSLQEMAATNEQLRLSNKELAATIEELRLANEQLNFIKDEVQTNNAAMTSANNDLENLLRSTQLATIFLDDRLNIRSFTPAAKKIYRLNATDIGRPLSDLASLAVDMPPLPDAASVCGDVSIEDTIQTQSGQSYIRRVLPYRTNKCEGIVVTFANVSDLREREELLRRSLDAAMMDAFELDLQTMQMRRQGELTTRLKLETQGTADNYFARVHPDDLLLLNREIRDTTTTHSKYSFTYRFEKAGGDYIWLRDDAEVYFDNDGNPVRVVGSCRDVTQEEQFKDALDEARRMAEVANETKSEFLANMSHEIRTPMSAIIGYADILARHLNDPDDLNCVRIIHRNGKFLLEIINDILDISKIEAGKLELVRKSFRLDRLLQDVRSLMQVRAAEKMLDFSVELDGEIPQSVKSDSKRLKQVLVNLVGNAIKFTQTGMVKLSVRFLRGQPESTLQFEIVDTGIGMDESTQHRLFEPFSQADSSVNRKFGGTGLGLAISQRLAKMLGGEIVVESRVGKGSKFTLSILIDDVDEIRMLETISWEKSSLIIPSRPSTPVAISGKILVVDDRREIRFIAQQFIQDAGGAISTAGNGQAAINSIKAAHADEAPYDLVVMDMQMPVLDGYEATRRLRASGFNKPIIALTAHAMEGDRMKCLAVGCSDYIAKPLDGPKFVELIARHLNPQPFVAEPKQTKILIIDDGQEACEAVAVLLGLNGHDVRTASDGSSGIETARNFLPHVILIDLGLPDMTGYEVLETLQSEEAFSDTMFIAATGRQNNGQTIEAGFHHHLLKPLNVDELEQLWTPSIEEE